MEILKSLIKDDCAVLITTQANDNIAHIHNRMPLLIDPTDWAVWLGELQGVKAAKLMKTPSHIEMEVINVNNEIKSTNAPVWSPRQWK